MTNEEFDKLTDRLDATWEQQHWENFISWLDAECREKNITKSVAITRDMVKEKIEDYSEGEYCRAKNIGFHRIPMIMAFLRNE